MMEQSPKSKDVNKIQTFVFMDIEATGLKNDNPRIAELSMIAVSRGHLLEMSNSPRLTPIPHDPDYDIFSNSQGSLCSQNSSKQTPPKNSERPEVTRKYSIPKLPRVLHKYTRLYYPWKLVPPFVEKINGLSNERLEHLPSFTEASAQALLLFLDLPKPVSLVAHNGNRYDFPLLMAELFKVGCSDKFPDLLCIDSLCAIKDIDSLIEKEDITEITHLAESFTFNDFNEDLLEEEFSPSKRQKGMECEDQVSQITHSPESTFPNSRENHHPLEVSAVSHFTPIKSNPVTHLKTPATPSRPKHTPEMAQPVTPSTFKSQALVSKNNKVRRTLTYNNGNKRKVGFNLLYNQPSIYRRLFNTDYTSHRAECDSLALLTICGHYGRRFVDWSDTFSKSLNTIEPMWVKRKSFTTA